VHIPLVVVGTVVADVGRFVAAAAVVAAVVFCVVRLPASFSHLVG